MTRDSVTIGDCLEELKRSNDESVDLVYLDPPFFTQKEHKLGTRLGDREFKFSDVWGSDDEYAEFIYARLCEIKRVLKRSGSVFFHCNRDSVHIARVILDRVFGAEEFRSEIIWYFRRWSNAQKGLLPAHQNILFYSRTSTFKFNQMMTEYSPSTNTDQIMQRRVRDSRGKAVYDRDECGEIVSNGAKKGVPLSDVWEIPYLNPKAKERVGYPTQKPILLLERIIELVTEPGDTVLDPFCGSGTTLVAAKILGRHWIGIDTSREAVGLSNNRLAAPTKTFSRLLEKGRHSYLNTDESVESVMYGVEYVRVQRNRGIDCILKEDVDGKPVLIRVQRTGESLQEAARALQKAARDKGDTILIVVIIERSLFEIEGVQTGQHVLFVHATSHALRAALDPLRSQQLLVKPRVAAVFR